MGSFVNPFHSSQIMNQVEEKLVILRVCLYNFQFFKCTDVCYLIAQLFNEGLELFLCLPVKREKGADYYTLQQH